MTNLARNVEHAVALIRILPLIDAKNKLEITQSSLPTQRFFLRCSWVFSYVFSQENLRHELASSFKDYPFILIPFINHSSACICIWFFSVCTQNNVKIELKNWNFKILNRTLDDFHHWHCAMDTLNLLLRCKSVSIPVFFFSNDVSCKVLYTVRWRPTVDYVCPSQKFAHFGWHIWYRHFV